jgi:hypothetical protein
MPFDVAEHACIQITQFAPDCIGERLDALTEKKLRAFDVAGFD